MKALLKIALFVFATPVVLIAIGLTSLAINTHSKTERRIAAVLESGFPGAGVSINERVDWDHANQICFDVTVQPNLPGSATHAVVMVRGDLDGGTWSLSRRRYLSIRECKKAFYRG